LKKIIPLLLFILLLYVLPFTSFSSIILVELTVSPGVGFHKYTFLKTDDAYIIFELYTRREGVTEERWVEIVADNEIVGTITGNHFCGAKEPHKIYFVTRFSKLFKVFGT